MANADISKEPALASELWLKKSRGVVVPPYALPAVLLLLAIIYVVGSGPGIYAVSRGWITWDTFRSIYAPMDEAIWGSPAHFASIRYRDWWRELGKRHRTGPLLVQGFSLGDRWVTLGLRREFRHVRPGQPEFLRFNGMTDDDILIIEDRVIALGPRRIRVNGRRVLDCRPDDRVEITSDGGTLRISVGKDRRAYQE